MDKISLIMPAYDIAWRTIARAIDSILDQDYTNWELIVVKNGVLDEGKIAKAVEPYLADKRIKLLQFDQGGACLARNRGAEVATGDIYSFFSSDFVMKAGGLRIWAERFRDNPDVDFVYGGYGWTNPDMQPYYSQEFDQYLLERGLNFIDGGMPIRKRAYVPWDEELKSLNDWEWAIHLIRKGAKPMYIPEIIYEADLPKPGGLSNDSSKNWLERTDYIRKKHGIPRSDICVSSLGAPFHGIKTAKALNADFMTYPTMKPHRYKMVYLLGFYCSNGASVQRHSEVFNYTRGTRIKKVIHWIGSDIQGMLGMSWGANRNLVDAFNREKFIHLVECGQTKGELEAMGLKCHVVPLPMDVDQFKITPLPKEPVIAVYFPEGNNNYRLQYNSDLMQDIAESMPDVKFKFFGGNRVQTLNNVEYVGYVDHKDMPDFISTCTAILRVTLHDGLPISPIEFLLSGREALVTVPNMPGTTYLGHGRVSEDNYAQKKEEIIKGLRDMLATPTPVKERLAQIQYWRDKVNIRKSREVMNDILRGKYDA